jgi:exopolysaccharide biosynthesis polyprenyl glycosylphosphotransferase
VQAAALRGGLWVPLDVLTAGGAMLLGHRLSPHLGGEPLGPEAWRAAMVYAAVFLLMAHACGLYRPSLLARPSTLALRTGGAAALAAAATLGVFYVAFYRPIGRWVTAGAIVLATLGSLLPRVVLLRLTRRRRRRVLFLGADALARRMADALGHPGELPYEVAGSWRDGRVEDVGAGAGRPVPADDLPELFRTLDVDDVILPTRPEDLDAVLAPALRCLPLGCRVRVAADLYEELYRSVPVGDVPPGWLLGRGLDTWDPLAAALKRGSDVALALLFLGLAAPVLGLAALLVALGGDGPVLYHQVRVGRYGRPFRMWKLRTMRVDAEPGPAQWAQAADPRRTAAGRILRRTRLDELPQLWNILRGDMSFVGPRPERPEFVARLEREIPYYAWRHLVRPGLTGWAQVNCPYGATVDDARRKLEHDVYYIRHASLAIDLAIVLRTATAAARGSR